VWKSMRVMVNPVYAKTPENAGIDVATERTPA